MNVDASRGIGVSDREDAELEAQQQHGSAPLRAWLVDLTLAYLGGLTIGAPLGLVTARYFGNDAVIDLVMVAVMLLTVTTLRARRPRSGLHPTA